MIEGWGGKRLLVVGASAGIGRAVAIRAAKQGADLAVVARRQGALEELVTEMGRGTAIVADLRSPDDCARVGEEAAATLGAIDVVLFTAAIARLRTLRQHTPEEWMEVLSTNLVGPNLVISGILPHLSERGIVAVMSSESAGDPFHALGAYAASKSAVEDTMRAWRIEHPSARFVTIVVGSTMPTDFVTNFDPDEMMAMFPTWAAQGKARAEFMAADEVADVVVGLFSSLLLNRTVGVETLFLRSPAPPVGTVEAMSGAGAGK